MKPLRSRWSSAPWWAGALVMALIYTGITLLGRLLLWPEDLTDNGLVLVAVTVGNGLLYGLLLAVFVLFLRRRMTRAAGVVDRQEFREVLRAAERGPVPTDPRRRAAARRLLEYRLAQRRRLRVMVWVMSALVVAFCLWVAFVLSPWWALALPAFGLVWAADRIGARRMRRRLALLSGPPPPSH